MGLAVVDSHVHLQEEVFSGDRAQVLERAWGAGVQRMACCGTSSEDWGRVCELAAGDGRILPFLGVHPWLAESGSAETMTELERRLRTLPGAGVGEIGLDYAREVDRDLQHELFARQLELAVRLGRPAVVHSVRAWAPTVAMLKEADAGASGFVMHSFGGSVEIARELDRLGAYFSFNAMGLRKSRAEKTADLLRAIDPERVLVESDSPYGTGPRAVHPYGRRMDGTVRNEPANLPAIAAALGELAGIEAEAFARRTMENAERFLRPLLETAG